MKEVENLINYEIKKKNIVVAYLLFIFFSYISAHRFYMGKWVSALIIIILEVLGFLFLFAAPTLGFTFLGIAALWLFLDIFLTAVMVQKYNINILKSMEISKDIKE